MDTNRLEKIRSEIDALDRELAGLIEKRMDLVSLVAEYKSRNNVNVLDAKREEKVIENALSVVSNADYSNSIRAAFESIMALSREYQRKKIKNKGVGAKRYALIGEHLSHSMSVPVHEAFFSEAGIQDSYELMEIPRNELPGVLCRLKAEGFSGINVTIPYKTEIMSQLDSVSAEAERIGAVNTILLDEKFKGYNTDYGGF
ncbi:MAG TPA: chorismate mutase, partial [Ruminiclostridium sp.]|nr:chorismate mutase [Ruminiclostridium sp.]